MKTPKRAYTKNYKISMDFGSEVVEGKGETIEQALASIERPVKIVGKTHMVVKYGKKKLDKVLMPDQAKRMFYPLSRVFLAKQLELLVR